MPEWLMQEEAYAPKPDKDSFIDKTVMSILRILSKIRAQSGYRTEGFGVSAVLKVICTLILIVLLSLSGSLMFVAVVHVYLLLAVSMMQPDRMVKVLKLSLLGALFSFAILLPAAIGGNTYSMAMITPKVFATVMAVNLLAHSTPWNSITSALKSVFVPDIFILVLDIAIKYIVLLGEFSLHMLYALKLRSVGKNSRKMASLSGIAGTMFLKSKEMAEEMYSAMECRGFTGEYRITKKFRLAWADLVFLLINAAIAFTFFYLRKV